MNYKQENKAKIQKIKILNKVYCSDTVSPSSSPQPSVPPVVTSSCVSYITALNERVGYENGNIKLPIPNTVSDWSLTVCTSLFFLVHFLNCPFDVIFFIQV